MALESVKQVQVPTLKVGQALIDPSALTAPRTYALPDAGGQIALLSDIGAASGLTYLQTLSAVSLRI